ncbi:hypothetical protein REPUB_Repub08aG0109500 [Reevesia pubescens]
MNINTALPLVVRKARAHGGLARGFHEVVKAIEKHNAHLCVIADDCDQSDYVKLVKALCADHNCKDILRVPSGVLISCLFPLCKIDSEGKSRKVVGCSCVVVKFHLSMGLVSYTCYLSYSWLLASQSNFIWFKGKIQGNHVIVVQDGKDLVNYD